VKFQVDHHVELLIEPRVEAFGVSASASQGSICLDVILPGGDSRASDLSGTQLHKASGRSSSSPRSL